MEQMDHNKIYGVNVWNCSIVMVGVRSEHRDGRDRVTKNVGEVGARSEKGQIIVTVTKNIGASWNRVGAEYDT